MGVDNDLEVRSIFVIFVGTIVFFLLYMWPMPEGDNIFFVDWLLGFPGLTTLVFAFCIVFASIVYLILYSATRPWTPPRVMPLSMKSPLPWVVPLFTIALIALVSRQQFDIQRRLFGTATTVSLPVLATLLGLAILLLVCRIVAYRHSHTSFYPLTTIVLLIGVYVMFSILTVTYQYNHDISQRYEEQRDAYADEIARSNNVSQCYVLLNQDTPARQERCVQFIGSRSQNPSVCVTLLENGFRREDVRDCMIGASAGVLTAGGSDDPEWNLHSVIYRMQMRGITNTSLCTLLQNSTLQERCDKKELYLLAKMPW